MNTLSLVFPLRCAKKLSASSTDCFYRDTKHLVLEFNSWIAKEASQGYRHALIKVPKHFNKDAVMFVCACFEEEGYEVIIETSDPEQAYVHINWVRGEQYD